MARPNQDVESLAADLSNPNSGRRGSVFRRDLLASPGAGDHQRNGKKRRIQRRTCIESSSCSNPSATLLDPPIDPIPPRPSSGTISDSVASQVDVNLPFHLVASQRTLSIPRTEHVSDIKEPLVADFSSVFSYILRDYDPNARHFDGLTGVRSEDILIDLDTDSMERQPDVRAYFYYIGYGEVHDLRRDDLMDPIVREQEYVRAGRLALLAERTAGRGLFLDSRDWLAMREDEEDPCAWMDHVMDIAEAVADGRLGEAERLGHTGFWDLVLARYEWPKPFGCTVTNLRAPLPPRNHMLVGPGHPKWTYLVADPYIRHPLTHLGYTPVEQQYFIMSRVEVGWYDQEIELYHDHFGGNRNHDSEDCVYCQAVETY